MTLLIIAILAAFWSLRLRHKERLRRRFGPEYDRAARELGNIYRAEAELEARLRRFEGLHVHSLSSQDATRFADAWCEFQRRFIDDPERVATDPDRLIRDVMQSRGWPKASIAQPLDVNDLSVDCPYGVSHYRAAKTIVGMYERGEASYDDLRQAVVHYRALFDDLLDIDWSGLVMNAARG